MKFLKKFRNDVRGAVTAKSIVTLAIGFVLLAYLIPIGLDGIYAANTTLWETAVTTIFTVVLPLIAVIAGALMFITDLRT